MLGRLTRHTHEYIGVKWIQHLMMPFYTKSHDTTTHLCQDKYFLNTL